MTTLLLRLAGPLQSWGDSSRFTQRGTADAPSKSGVVGLLAAALGRRRIDPIEDLFGLRFGVRIDQPGRIERDFQTAQTLDKSHAFPLTHRFYRADAVFLAGVESDDGALVRALDDAVRRPTFPLYLGRRSCPPVGPLTLGVHDEPLGALLARWPWQAAPWWKRRHGHETDVLLDVAVDDGVRVPGTVDDDATMTTRHDAPLSFDPVHRTYGWRTVRRHGIAVPNDTAVARTAPPPPHDPMSVLGDA